MAAAVLASFSLLTKIPISQPTDKISKKTFVSFLAYIEGVYMKKFQISSFKTQGGSNAVR